MAPKTKLGDLTAQKRKTLQPSQFALPEKKAYPIHDASHVRNAAARLEQAKKAKRVTPSEYRRARAAIARAAKHFGVRSQYLETRDTSTAPPPLQPSTAAGVRVSVHTHPSGHRRVDVFHGRGGNLGAGSVTMGDRLVFGDERPSAIDAAPLAEVAQKLVDVEGRLKTLPEGSADRPALEADLAKLRDELVIPRWNQVAQVGEFLGHPAGPFELTPAIFEQAVRNYNDVDRKRVCIDFEHASEADETSGSIPVTGAPAQGRILDLQNRGAEGLWGLCKFFEPALTYVREGKYPFFSPAIRFGAKHPKTGQPIGARLTSVGLVTRPFLREMQPLAARDPAAPPGTITMSLPTTHHEMMKALKASMRLPDVATAADMRDHIGKLREHAKAILDKPAVHATGHYSAGGVHCGDYLPQLAEAINAPAHMPVAEILDAVEEMIDAAIERHEAEMHTMSDSQPTNDDPAIALGQTQEKLRARDGEVRVLTTEKSTLELKLKDADAKAADATQKLDLATAELKTLRDAETARGEKAIADDVDLAFTTYKDVKRLSDTDRKAMTIVRKTDPATFAALYPAVPPNKQHLLRDLSTARTPAAGAPPVTAPGGGPAAPGTAILTAAEQVTLCDRLIREKKMPREAATSLAFQVAVGQRPMPTFAAT